MRRRNDVTQDSAGRFLRTVRVFRDVNQFQFEGAAEFIGGSVPRDGRNGGRNAAQIPLRGGVTVEIDDFVVTPADRDVIRERGRKPVELDLTVKVSGVRVQLSLRARLLQFDALRGRVEDAVKKSAGGGLRGLTVKLRERRKIGIVAVAFFVVVVPVGDNRAVVEGFDMKISVTAVPVEIPRVAELILREIAVKFRILVGIKVEGALDKFGDILQAGVGGRVGADVDVRRGGNQNRLRHGYVLRVLFRFGERGQRHGRRHCQP